MHVEAQWHSGSEPKYKLTRHTISDHHVARCVMRLKSSGPVAADERNVRDESVIPMQCTDVRDASSCCRITVSFRPGVYCRRLHHRPS